MTPAKKKSGLLASIIELLGLLAIVFLVRTFGFGLYQVPTGSMETSMLVGERFFADKLSYVFRNPRRGEVIAFNEPPMFYAYSDNKLTNLFQHYVWGPSNWTKRVIGEPGDTVQGVIENGKPVIYVNGKKLDEPYLNKYPLIYVWKDDPQVIREHVRSMFRPLYFTGNAEIARQLERQEMLKQTTPKSYDPDAPFDQQPFYRIAPSRICREEDGSVRLLYPATPIKCMPTTRVAELTAADKNFWGDGSDEFLVHLGPDEYWLMGDNRMGSKDARVFGPVKREFIHGRIVFRIWSMDSDESWWIVDLIKNPIDFWKRVRWSRFFQWIN